MEKQFELAHGFSSHHRKQLQKDEICGCFYCLKIFHPSEIMDWCDNENTAICPYCGTDSIIGSSSGFPITELFLKGMHQAWF
ncbi:MAG: cytoplasmic protein [Neobacillus sp.]